MRVATMTARATAPTVAVHEALGYIQRLYHVEDEAASLSREDRLRFREEHSVAILHEFHGSHQP